MLRFIGDAVLAIFPIDESARDDGRLIKAACETALEAARDASARIAHVNEARRQRGDKKLGFGIALHVGDVMYGNIGTTKRLEFTVIGAAANEAARIESLSKVLGHPVLVSSEMADHVPEQLRSLGHHALRGVGETKEIFALTA